MTDLFKLILGILASRFKARATLEAENLVLRHRLSLRNIGARLDVSAATVLKALMRA